MTPGASVLVCGPISTNDSPVQSLTFPAPTGYNPNHAEKKKQKHQAANFTEAWVEFLDKNVAKTVASMLNAQAIGGKKGDR